MVLLLQRAELWPDSAVRRPKTKLIVKYKPLFVILELGRVV